MTLHYILLGVVSSMAMVLLCIIINNNETLDRRMKIYFTSAILGIIIVTLAEVGAYLFEKPYYTNFRILALVCNIIGFSTAPLIPLFITLAISKLDYKKIVLCFLPGIVNIVFTFFSPVFGFIFTISSPNIYSRGPFYSVFLLSYLWGTALLALETVKINRRYPMKNSCILYFIVLYMMLGTSIQIILPMVRTTWICVALSITIYYAYFCEISVKFDAQTYLFNRRAYDCEIERMGDSGQGIVLLFDIDDFKIINDTYGHQVGDQCLYMVAGCIKEVFQDFGLCFRIGGDEFCVITKQLNEEKIENAKLEFLKRIEECRKKDVIIPNVSIGYAVYKKGHCKVDEAIKLADEQLYIFKKMQKESVKLW